MRKNINKAKFIGKTIIRKFIAMSLVISMGFCGVSLEANAQSDNVGSDFSRSTSSQPLQEDYISQDISYDSFSCLFNFFCFFPAVILTIFRILTGGAQSFGSTSSKDK